LTHIELDVTVISMATDVASTKPPEPPAGPVATSHNSWSNASLE
jgi:hypothetical protein